ncbi:MAG TPA: MipA/OmpV family protein [Burkholderiales bacterium]
MKKAFLGLCAALLSASALANSDPLTGVAAAGGAGIGALTRFERSPYRGAGQRYDFLPLYLYEGEHGYLHSYSVGLKFGDVVSEPRFDIFLRHRFEGFPYDRIPDSIAGMAQRQGGIDAGASAQIGGGWGIAFAEALHDVSATSHGSEFKLGYRYPWRSGRLWLRPHAYLGFRDARLNDYYYGVRPGEATPTRPAYSAGSGLNTEIGLYAAYNLTERWRLLGGITYTRWPKTVRDSPVVDLGTQRQVTLGLMYDITPEHEAWPTGRPLIMRVYHGDSSDCNVLQIAELRCTTTHTKDRTTITGFDVGRPFIEKLNGWPLDIAGFLGVIRHNEAGFQPDFWQLNAYFKAYYYGFPWTSRVRTRVGLGVGLSYAQRISQMEVRDLADRGRNTSKLLEVLDPTVDINVGDITGVRALRDTYAGLGVSHRSGIFGSSHLFGNTNGGSNFIYSYLEWSF